MSDVVLVYPTPTNEQTETVGPPLSILYLGAFLENQGIEVLTGIKVKKYLREL